MKHICIFVCYCLLGLSLSASEQAPADHIEELYFKWSRAIQNNIFGTQEIAELLKVVKQARGAGSLNYLYAFETLHHVQKSHFERAQKTVKQISANIGKQDAYKLRLLVADVARTAQSYVIALRFANAVGAEAEDLHRVLSREVMGDVSVDRRELPEALQIYKKARREIDIIDRYREDTVIRPRLDKKTRAVTAMITMLKHGPGFLYYRKGRVSMLGKRSQDAIDTFKELLNLAEQNKGNDHEKIAEQFKQSGGFDYEALINSPYSLSMLRQQYATQQPA